ncbi:MAG TPA: CDP-diacylglycerol diphosphatase [Trinickia sp.]|jgi:CDP-diacylglycerol pyrophosphatase|uniref:CDP-diacylglycerol diphosphatase n=1 Tax=Trinickia sp. TaxID=2571163 RepID=UPI002BB89405|nr:CDP-diacylglycerol diphosphatase [Trinickia sp.]HTI18015.1 CDP-diacylglycerol diphosphatase [Trinickia sp.]
MLGIFKWVRARTGRFALCAVVLMTGCETLAEADPNALWQIVHLDCEPAARTTSKPGICASVDLTHRDAVLKDRKGVAQHLLIPTDRISGIDSPLVLAPSTGHYWADAWNARSFVQASLKAAHRKPLEDDQLGLEINSAYRRSQEQLHIHIDCMRTSAIDALGRHRHDAPDQWVWDTIDGARYRIMRVSGPEFNIDPFSIVARDKGELDAMSRQTILVVGAGPSTQQDGWLLLNSGTDIDGGTGTAEVLLDHQCEVASMH